MPARAFSTDTDRTSVWIHKHGACVARFGRKAYEVMTADEPRRLLHMEKVTSARSWTEFQAKVLAAHGFAVIDGLTPHRFHKELGLTFGYDSNDEIFEIQLRAITRLSNPLKYDVWGRGRTTRASIQACIEQDRLASEFVPMGVRHSIVRPGWDSERVAFLVVNRDPWPISIEVTSPCGAWTIEDGFHRLAAAIYRKDTTILAGLSGYVDGWDVCFPKRVPIKLDT